jgi:hypothetical protein
MDLMATVLDVLGMQSFQGRPLDGVSLLPVLRGEMAVRPATAGIGIHGDFPYGDTNHQLNPWTNQLETPFRCPANSASASLGDVPSNFSSAGNGPQFSWAEGNHLKIFGCKGICTGSGKSCVNKTSGVPHPPNPGWHFFLYNLTADRAETTDLWASQRAEAKAMFGRFQGWQASVEHSKGPAENGCFPHAPTPAPPTPPTKYKPIVGMQAAPERCGSANASNVFGQQGAPNVDECAFACSQRKGCKYLSFSPGCGCCWLYHACDQVEKGSGWTYKDWSSYVLE